jgi:hypothetical protein
MAWLPQLGKPQPFKDVPAGSWRKTHLNLARLPIPPHPHVCGAFEFTMDRARGAAAVFVRIPAAMCVAFSMLL